MCGRTCCTMGPKVVTLACSTVTKDHVEPRWVDAPCGGEFNPSTNIPPTSYTPVMFQGGKDDCEFLVQPMLWGMVPFWHHGSSPAGHKLTTNNARLEGLGESRLYKKSVENDRRCVVVCDGFYEWKKLANTKQPYIVYAKQAKGEENFCCAGVDPEKSNWKSGSGWTGPRPLFLAGLYSIWYSDDDEDRSRPVYNYAVITRDSNSTLSWLHNRMPAILADEASVNAWLDKNCHGFDALDVLRPVKKSEISWHPVSKEVGNVRNKSDDLIVKVELDSSGAEVGTKDAKKSRNLMENWLGKKRKNEEDEKPGKAPKKES